MNKKSLPDRLKELARSNEFRSKTARLNDVLPEIELAISSGVSRAAIINELKEFGLELSISSFSTTISRLRKRRQKANPESIKQPNTPIERNQNQERLDKEKDNPPPSQVVASHKPEDLDTIINSKPDLAALAKYSKRKSS